MYNISTLHALVYLILKVILWGQYYYLLYVTDDKIKA